MEAGRQEEKKGKKGGLKAMKNLKKKNGQHLSNKNYKQENGRLSKKCEAEPSIQRIFLTGTKFKMI